MRHQLCLIFGVAAAQNPYAQIRFPTAAKAVSGDISGFYGPSSSLIADQTFIVMSRK
jgi:hypothetical protein